MKANQTSKKTCLVAEMCAYVYIHFLYVFVCVNISAKLKLNVFQGTCRFSPVNEMGFVQFPGHTVQPFAI